MSHVLKNKVDILVSIVVPIFNVEKYLERCLKSIINQDYRNIEIIMINDGSTDDSRRIAKEYADLDSRFVLYDKNNGGLSSARNYGLTKCNGEFVCFVDSDDFLFPDYVSSLMSGFSENDDVVIADYVIYDPKRNKSFLHGQKLKDQRFITSEDKKVLINWLFNGKYPVMSVWKNMYRTSFIKSSNLSFISERLVYAEDFLFNAEAYSAARSVHIISNIVFNHLIIQGSLSQGYRKNYFEMQKELYKRLFVLLDNYYDKAYSETFLKEKTIAIGSSMFQLCKCKWSEAIKNIKSLFKDDFTVDVYNNRFSDTGLFRYRFLYKIGRFRIPFFVVVCAKIMILLNGLYRHFQNKKIYIAKEV